jgi:cytochrome o ubiquinol oxidase subunit 2
VIWGVPLLIIIALGLITWISTHKLDPYRPLDRIDADRPLAADHEPLNVQVVSLDWKWLFIYPEQGVASVNELVTPVDTPVRFHITSSSTMNSFYIPALAGQIYSMPGMQTTLNAVINEPGEYPGFSAVGAAQRCHAGHLLQYGDARFVSRDSEPMRRGRENVHGQNGDQQRQRRICRR